MFDRFKRVSGKIKKIIKSLILPGCLFGFVFLAYGCWEAKQLECNFVEIPSSKLPDGLKICLISDIHGNVALLEKAAAMIETEKPDIVTIAGDFYSSAGRISRTHKMIEVLQRMNKTCPVYACLGNHDTERLESVTRMLSHTGITLLRNQKAVYHCNRLGKSIMIAGVGEMLECDFRPDLCLSLKNGTSPDLPILLLCHNATARFSLSDYQWDLMLCGHTHGYQFCYPFTKKSLFHRKGDPYSQGYLNYEGRSIYLTRGVGNHGGMRFFCPPEINILTIKSHTE